MEAEKLINAINGMIISSEKNPVIDIWVKDFLVEIKSSLEEQQKEIEELISLNLWSARRLPNLHKTFAYDDLEKITKQKHQRL